jgi:Mrp family chromosome partitioning ATPase
MAHSTTNNGRAPTSRQDRRHATSNRNLNVSNSQYKILLAQLRSLGYGPQGTLRTIGLTSSVRHEGVTTVACNLALYAASCHDLRVLLIDANFSNPKLQKIFQVQQSPGFADLINGDAVESDCIHDMSSLPLASWPAVLRQSFRRGRGLFGFVARKRKELLIPRLSVMPTGDSRPGMRSFYNTEDDRWLDLIGSDFDLVIVDLPATCLATSCGFKQSSLDGILLVLEAEATSDTTARKSLNLIREDGANLRGVVLNKYRTHLPKWIDKRLGER